MDTYGRRVVDLNVNLLACESTYFDGEGHVGAAVGDSGLQIVE